MISLCLVLLGGLAVLAAASLLGRALAPKLTPSLSFGIGAIAISYTIFLLMLVHGASKPILSAVLGVGVLLGLLRRPRITLHWPPWMVLAVCIPFGIWYMVNALAPEVQADPNVYHLQPAIDSLRHGGFSDTISFYDRLPHAIELLYVPAWRIGGSSAAKLVHFGFLIATLPLIVYLSRLLQLSGAIGHAAAALYFCTPVVGVTGTSAFNDAALVYFTLAAIALALERRPGYSGVVAGFCYAVKMTGLLAVPVAATFFLRRRDWRGALWVCTLAGAVCSPWLLRNWMQTGNPFAPFLNAWFPNPHFYVLTERELTQTLRDYGVPAWQRFTEVLVGYRLQGILGPVFVITPIALLAAGRRGGSVVLGLGAVLSIPWLMNAGARFAMPMLPFVALALCAALPVRALPVLVAAHAITCWPSIISLYRPEGFQSRDLPLRAALRLESEPDYLTRVSLDYRYAKLVEQHTPANARILDLWGVHSALAQRELIGHWRSAQAVRLVDGLEAARPGGKVTMVAIRADFDSQSVCGFRIIQTKDAPSSLAVYSTDLQHANVRVSPRSNWSVSSSKMRWEIPLAFDLNPVSRWSTGERAERGDYLQVEWNNPIAADSLQVVLSDGTVTANAQLQICSGGAWKKVTARTTATPGLNLRPAAVQLLKQAGITHVLVPAAYQGIGVLGERLINTADDWNLEVVANLYAVYLLKVR